MGFVQIVVDTASLPGINLSKRMLDVIDDQKDLTSDSATKMAGTMLTAGLGRKSNFRDTMEATQEAWITNHQGPCFFLLARLRHQQVQRMAFDQQDTRL
jgi:hypothetical protein